MWSLGNILIENGRRCHAELSLGGHADPGNCLRHFTGETAGVDGGSAYVGGEIDRYNNATALLQNLWEAYARSYIRSHRPTRRELNYLGGDRI